MLMSECVCICLYIMYVRVRVRKQLLSKANVLYVVLFLLIIQCVNVSHLLTIQMSTLLFSLFLIVNLFLPEIGSIYYFSTIVYL